MKRKYEVLFFNSDHVMNDVFNFINNEDKASSQFAHMNIKNNSVGKGRVELENSEIDAIKPIITNTMARNGYKI